VYRLRPGGSVTITMQFRDWRGMLMEHCHNTTHEDNAMLLRWEISDAGDPFLAPLPTPIPKPQGVRFENPYEIIAQSGACGVRYARRRDHVVRQGVGLEVRRRCHGCVLSDGAEVLAAESRYRSEAVLRQSDVGLRPDRAMNC